MRENLQKVENLYIINYCLFYVMIMIMENSKNNVIEEQKKIINGKNIIIQYVTKEALWAAFWTAYFYENRVAVRYDLPKFVKRFVTSHELQHIKYWPKWSVLKKELRANLIPGMKDPLWLFMTIFHTLISKERREFYKDRIKNNY